MNYFEGKALTFDWASQHIPIWEWLLGAMRHEAPKVLEIGSFEGRSTLFFLQFWPKAHVTCIDTSEGNAEHLAESSHFRTDMPRVEARFDENTKPFFGRVEKMKAYSIEALSELQRLDRHFDVIYVDADHRATSVFADAEQSWSLLVAGGIMILDDYLWEQQRPVPERPKAGIDAFLQLRAGEFDVLHDGYQMIIQKKHMAASAAASDITIGGRSIRALGGGLLSPPLVSFVVIAWNYGKYVGATIDSIRRQDYPHFECLVINNGSTDNSADVIAKHIEGDSRFRVETLPENLGQLGAAFWALDKIKGGFVTFVDADDILFESYASTHVQAHISLPSSVALTSTNVAEMDADGRALASAGMYVDTKRRHLIHGLKPRQAVLRLPSISDMDYENLAANTATAPRWMRGWLWGPGTANMYRTSILRLVKRGDGNAYMRSADGYFNYICHGFAGSALISETRSGYRLHTENYFSARESFPSLRAGTIEYEIRYQEATITDIEFMLANAKSFAWMLNDAYWDVIDLLTRREKKHLRNYYSDERLFELFVKYAPTIKSEFRPRAFCREILARFAGGRARSILRAGFSGRLGMRAYYEIAASPFGRAKRKFQK